MDLRACEHYYWPQIREDGEANVWKCGRCGLVKPWSVGDEAEAYAEGDRLRQEHHRRADARRNGNAY